MEHSPHWALQKGHSTGMTWAMPRIGTLRGVIGERTEKWRRKRIQINLRLTNNVTRYKLWGVFIHMNKAM